MKDGQEVWKITPAVFVIETSAMSDGQSVRHRYEAPSVEEVIRLAERCGEVFDVPPVVVEAKR